MLETNNALNYYDIFRETDVVGEVGF